MSLLFGISYYGLVTQVKKGHMALKVNLIFIKGLHGLLCESQTWKFTYKAIGPLMIHFCYGPIC